MGSQCQKPLSKFGKLCLKRFAPRVLRTLFALTLLTTFLCILNMTTVIVSSQAQQVKWNNDLCDCCG